MPCLIFETILTIWWSTQRSASTQGIEKC